MTGLRDDPPHIEGDEVTATCTIERIYPWILPSAFNMTWGDSTEHASLEQNKDGSYKSNVTMKRELTMADDKRNITCKVKPIHGHRVQQVKTLSVECE